ncbi:MAG: hypothetical protein KAG66_24195, partial [Methylococcales bacterium]|nr:hypothetical protein [Methylococcales bacterium]
MNSAPFTIQITSTFVAEPIEESLGFLGKEIGIAVDIRFSEYNQVFQQLLAPASESARNESGINLFFIRLEDCSESDPSEEIVNELVGAFKDFSNRSRAKSLAIFCPHNDRSSKSQALEKTAIAKLKEISKVDVISTGEIELSYPVQNPFDSEADRSGKIPFTG